MKILIIFFVISSFKVFALEGGMYPQAFVIDIHFAKDSIGTIIFSPKNEAAKLLPFESGPLRKSSTSLNNTVIDHLLFIVINRSTRKTELFTEDEYKEKFGIPKNKSFVSGNLWKRDELKDSLGNKWKVSYRDCEGVQEVGFEAGCANATVDYQKFKMNIDLLNERLFGTFIYSYEDWENYFLYGIALNNGSPSGSGVVVYDKETKQKVKEIYNFRATENYNKSQDLDVTPTASVIKKDPFLSNLWIGGEYGIYEYNKKLDIVSACNLFVSYVDEDNEKNEFVKERFIFNCENKVDLKIIDYLQKLSAIEREYEKWNVQNYRIKKNELDKIDREKNTAEIRQKKIDEVFDRHLKAILSKESKMKEEIELLKKSRGK